MSLDKLERGEFVPQHELPIFVPSLLLSPVYQELKTMKSANVQAGITLSKIYTQANALYRDWRDGKITNKQMEQRLLDLASNARREDERR